MAETPKGVCPAHEYFEKNITDGLNNILRVVEEMKSDQRSEIDSIKNRLDWDETTQRDSAIVNERIKIISEENGRKYDQIQTTLSSVVDKLDKTCTAVARTQGAEEARKQMTSQSASQKKNSETAPSSSAKPDSNISRALLISVIALAIVILVLIGVKIEDIIKIVKP